MSNEVRIHASVKDDVSQPLTGIKSKIQNIGQEAKGSILTGVGLGAGIGAFNLLEKGVSAVTDVIGDSIEKAKEDQVSFDKLYASLKANVPAWDGNRSAIEKYTAAGAKLGFTDGEMADSLALLAAATHDLGKAQEVQAVAQDLARFKGISLMEASQALTKVEGGQFRMLKSLGIVLKDGATATDALAAVQKVAANQATTYANTAAGAQARLNASWEEAQEKLGYLLLPAVTELSNVLVDDLIPAFSDTVGVISDASGAVGGLLSALDQLSGHSKDAADSGSLLGDVWNGVWDSLSPGSRKTLELANDIRKVRTAVNTEVAAIPDDMREHERGISTAAKALAGSLAEGLASGNPAIEAEARAAINTYGDALGGPEGRQKIRANQKIIAREIKSGWVPIDHDALLAGSATSKSFADGLRQKRSEIDDAMTQIIEDLKHPMARGKDIAHNLGYLTSKALRDGLKSGDPLIKAEAEAEKDAILARLEELRTQTGPIGKHAMDMLGRAMHSKDPYIRSVAAGIWNTVHHQLSKKVDGSSIGSSWVNSIARGINNSHTQLLRAIANVDGFMAGKSPPKEGPLKNLTGAPIGEWWVRDVAKGVRRGMGDLHRSLDGLGASLGPGPSMAMAGGGGGLTIIVQGVSVLTPGSAEALAHHLGPTVTRWQQRRGLIPAR